MIGLLGLFLPIGTFNFYWVCLDQTKSLNLSILSLTYKQMDGEQTQGFKQKSNSKSQIMYKIRYSISLWCLNTFKKLTCFFYVFKCQNKCFVFILFEFHLDYSKHWLINFYFTCVHNVNVNGLFFIDALRWKHGKIDPKVKHNKFVGWFFLKNVIVETMKASHVHVIIIYVWWNM